MSAERDPLEDLLVREPYVDDAGFTERVMASLPAPRRDPRPLVLGLSAAVAAGLAAAYLPAAVGELARSLGEAVRGLAIPTALAPAGGTAVLAGLACLAAAALAGAALTRRA